MTQIYVVMNQFNMLSTTPRMPVAAFTDYPDAYSYAMSIFKPVFGSKENARDLIYLINLTQPAAPATPVAAPVSQNATVGLAKV